MVVSRFYFRSTLRLLAQYTELSLDCETTGLYPYRNDQLFSIIISGGEGQSHYFNFKEYLGLHFGNVLLREELHEFQALFSDPAKTWFMHNAKFDLAFLAQEGLQIAGEIHCTQAAAVLENNTHLSYSLKSCAERIGLKKDDAVEKYIAEHKLWDWQNIPGKKTRTKKKYFDRVPFDIIVPYGIKDAEVTYRLGKHQKETFQALDEKDKETGFSLQKLHANEKNLTKTVFQMERCGVGVDRSYCQTALRRELCRATEAERNFKLATGEDFKASGKTFEAVFASDKERWHHTPKGNPSFSSDALKRFSNPAAQAVLEYRDAKSKADFYHGFLYHVDYTDSIHPNLHPDGTGTGRFSSSEPNFQNLTGDDGEDAEYTVRRAIVPRPGYFLVELDYVAMEFRCMVDYAGQLDLATKIKEGLDPHQATAELVGVSRKEAKTLNFGLLYGMGATKLGAALGVDEFIAKEIRRKYFTAMPQVRSLMARVSRTAEIRGHIFNKFGRRYYFSDPQWSYKATNYLIQGTCADTVKISLNRIADYLQSQKTRMILTVHDSILLEVAPDESHHILKIKEIMEEAYPYSILPMAASVSYSHKSWGDMVEGMPK